MKRLAAALLAITAALPALSQEWPSKPVKVVVPFPPGGGTDTVARPLSAKLSTLSGQQFINDNRGGAGKIRPIAVTSAKRSPSFPDIPTAMEQGLPNFDVTSWYGLWVPAGTPRPIVQRLHGLVVKAFEEADIKDLWFKLGAEHGGASPEQFAAFQKKEIEKWGKVVRDAKVMIE